MVCAFYDAPGSFETTPGTTASAASASRKRVGRAAGGPQEGLPRRQLRKGSHVRPEPAAPQPSYALEGPPPRSLGPAPDPKAPPTPGPTWMTLRLRPVMSASFCSVCASGLLSCANCACITCQAPRGGEARARRGRQGPGPIRGSGPEATPQTATAPPRHPRVGQRGGVRRPVQPRPLRGPAHTRPLAARQGTCNCSAVKDVRARLAGLG